MKEQDLRDLISDVKAGRLSRRAFVQQMIGVGLTAPIAGMMLSQSGVAWAATEMPYKPTNVAFAKDGGFYVADGYGSHFIHQYDKDAKWVRTWGGFGKEAGKMNTPHGIWLDDRPGRKQSLVVADRANARLQYFTLDGKHIGFVNDVLFPAHFDIRGEVLMVPDLHARVSLFDKDNKPIIHLGDDAEWRKKVLDGFKVRNKPEEWPAGKFVHPHDACFDKDGNIFVVEWVQTGRVTLLRRVG